MAIPIIDLTPYVWGLKPMPQYVRACLGYPRFDDSMILPGAFPEDSDRSSDRRDSAQHEHQGYMRIGEVLDLLGISRASLYRRISRNEFIAPTRLSARLSGWPRSKVYAYLNELEG